MVEYLKMIPIPVKLTGCLSALFFIYSHLSATSASFSPSHPEYSLSFTLHPNQGLGFRYCSSLKRRETKIRSVGNMQNQPLDSLQAFQGRNSERNRRSNLIVGSGDDDGTQFE